MDGGRGGEREGGRDGWMAGREKGGREGGREQLWRFNVQAAAMYELLDTMKILQKVPNCLILPRSLF